MASAEGGSMSRRLRVLMVTGEYPPDQGGVADYTRCLTEALAAGPVSVDVLTTRRRRASVSDDPRVDEAATPRGGSTGVVAEHRAMRDWSWGALRAMSRVARILQPDVVHIQYQAAAFGMGPAIHFAPVWLRRWAWWQAVRGSSRRGSGRRLATVATFHDLRVPYLFPKAGRLRSDAVHMLAGRSDLAIVTNSEDAGALAGQVRPESLALVPIGSNVPDDPPDDYDRAAWRAAHGLPADAPVLAYFGFLNESKGARTLAGALEELAAQGRDPRLVMIGGRVGASDPTNAEYLESFEAELEQRGLGDLVLWTGHVSSREVSAWFHAADAAALPYVDGASYRRGSLMAALTHGVPVVTTIPREAPATADAIAPTELVDRRTAMLTPAGDAGALAAAIAEVLDDASLAATLSRGARELAKEFAWDGIAARHVELYRQLLVSGGST